MTPLSKESIFALRRFINTPAGKEVMGHLRSSPPTVKLDKEVHVYAHSSGIREGWMKCLEALEEIEDSENQSTKNSIDRLDIN
jgi:hypothetical protein